MSEEAAQEAALGLLNLSPANSTLSPSLIPAKRKQDLVDLDADSRDDVQPEAISCICGFTHDDGFQIGCESCPRWAHAMCFGIGSANVPEKWYCWRCKPRRVDRERAAKYQREYMRTLAAETGHAQPDRRGRTSPGTERKSRKSSGTKRRVLEEEQQHVDIMTEDEPWKDGHARMAQEELPRTNSRSKPLQTNQGRRDAPSISVYDLIHPTHTSPRDYARQPPPSTPVSLYPSIGHGRPLSRSTNAPSHSPAQRLPSPQALLNSRPSTRLADPLDSYAHLGMPKPVVKLTGPLSDMTRVEHSRSRSRQQPNAILRPIMCRRANTSHGDSPASSADALTFGIFAVRDLRANEEVVLGWEWDDGHALHSLPAEIEAPAVFPKAPSSFDQRFPSHDQPQFRSQLNNVLHTFSSSFTTCACGAQSRDCALARMDPQASYEMSRYFDTHTSSRKSGYHSADIYGESSPSILVSPASPNRRARGSSISQESWPSEPVEESYYSHSRPTAPPSQHYSHQHRAHIFSDSRSISPRSPYSPEPRDKYDKDPIPYKIRKVWRQRDSDSTSPSESGTAPSERAHSHPMEIDEGLPIYRPSSQNRDRYGAIAISPTAPFSKLSLVSPVTATDSASLPRVQQYYSPAQEWAPIKRRDHLPLREDIESQSISASRLGSPARHISFPSSSERYSPPDAGLRPRREEYSPLDGLAEAACKASAALAESAMTATERPPSGAAAYSPEVEESAKLPVEDTPEVHIPEINDYEHPIAVEMEPTQMRDETEDEDENGDENQETDMEEDVPGFVSADVEMGGEQDSAPPALRRLSIPELPIPDEASESPLMHPMDSLPPPPSPSPTPQLPDPVVSPVAEPSTEPMVPTADVVEPEVPEEPTPEPTADVAKEATPEPVKEPTPEPVREPTPPPPPKKLSLKDFTALKRKKKEEEAMKRGDAIPEATTSQESTLESSDSTKEQEGEQMMTDTASATSDAFPTLVVEEARQEAPIPVTASAEESSSIPETTPVLPDEEAMKVDIPDTQPVLEAVAEPTMPVPDDSCPSPRVEEVQISEPAAPPQQEPNHMPHSESVDSVLASSSPMKDNIALHEPDTKQDEEVEAGEVTETDMKVEKTSPEPQPVQRSPSPLPAKPEALIIFPPRSNGIGNPDRALPLSHAKYPHYPPPSRPSAVSRFDNPEPYRAPPPSSSSSSRFDYEDGEITGGPSSSSVVAPPRKPYAPPTGPRSFNPPSGPSSSWKKPISATTHNGRPPPTGPRSLRTGAPPPAVRSMRLSPTSSSYIPRGPSSDRDRDRLDPRRIGRAGPSWNAR